MRKLVESLKRVKSYFYPEYIPLSNNIRTIEYSGENCTTRASIQNSYLKHQDGYFVYSSSLLNYNLMGVLLTGSRTVCDIGGGLASAYYQLKDMVNIDYTLIERENVISGLDTIGYSCKSDLSIIGSKKFDAILMESSFQYISEQVSLKRIAFSANKVLIVQRTPFFQSKETTACAQITRRTAERAKNIVTIWNYNEFVSSILASGFDLISQDVSNEGYTYFKDGLIMHRIVYMNLLFRKNEKK